jgi:hypothetical protein
MAFAALPHRPEHNSTHGVRLQVENAVAAAQLMHGGTH